MFAFPPKRTGAGGSEAQSLLQTSRAALTTTSWRLRGRPRAPVRRCPGQCIVCLSLAPSLFCFFSACRLSIICVSETSRPLPPPAPAWRVCRPCGDTGHGLHAGSASLPSPSATTGPSLALCNEPPQTTQPSRPPADTGGDHASRLLCTEGLCPPNS